MRVITMVRTLGAFGVAAACAFALSSCGDSLEQGGQTPVEGLTGGIAATVNGVEIEEDTITTSIQNWRTTNSYMEETVWGQWLVDNDYTPETFREAYLDSFVNQELIKQAAAENSIEISSTEIDEYVEKTSSYYNSDEEWKAALSSVGFTEQTYRDSIELGLLEKRLRETLAVAEDVTDEEVLETAQTYLSSFDGAKKSSHILFDLNDEEEAESVLDQLEAGSIEFAKAAEEYSTDSATASDGGNVGWDALSTLSTEYTEALERLGLDEISDLVTSDDGIHIIKCTEIFTAPEELTELSQVPEEFVDSIRTNLESTKASEAWTNWWEAYQEEADIVINDMPDNVPYNVDISQFTKTETEDETSGGNTGDLAVEADNDTEASGEVDAADTEDEQIETDAQTASGQPVEAAA